MQEANLSFITVNTRRYAIDKLNPLDAVAWGNRVISAIGPSFGGLADAFNEDKNMPASFAKALSSFNHEEVTKLLQDAYQHVYTPENESLADMAVFNAWFRKYPGDLYQVGVMAVYELVKDFFPSQLATAASAFQEKMSSSEAAL